MKTMLLYVGLAAALAPAQGTQDGNPRPEIHGVITEAGTHFGIAGLQVLLTLDGQPASTASTVVTDSQGAFSFHPNDFGHYKVEVKLEAYRTVRDPSHIDRNLGNPAVVVVTRGNPSEEVSFTVARAAEITGRVIDEETGLPLANVPVAAVEVRYSKGRRVSGLLGGMRAVTDNEGQFVFSGLLPGNFVVETLPRTLGNDRVMTQFSEADQNTVDEDFERTFWPGGRDLDSAAPISISGGQSLSAGTIKARKVPYYRVHAVFLPTNCTAADKVMMQFRSASLGGDIVSSEVPCGKDFLIRGVEPGSYRLQLATQRTLETRTQGVVSVEVTNKNLDAAVSLDPGVDLDGRIIFPEGVPQTAFGRLLVSVQPDETIFASGRPLSPDEHGRFRVPNAPWSRMTVSLINLSTSFYVREIRYNGNPVSGNAFNVTSNASSQTVEIVIDDKPALVSGVVAKDDQPLSKPYVVLAKWPFTAEDLFESVKHTTGGDDGSFRFAGLAPGEYRIVAVPPETKDKLDEPGVLERLFAGAAKITLDRGDFQNVPLKPTDPLH
jgi:protocatechuate 3,4-dioxygenase beta subunit